MFLKIRPNGKLSSTKVSDSIPNMITWFTEAPNINKKP